MGKEDKFLDALRQNLITPKAANTRQGVATNIGTNKCDVELTENSLVITDVLFNATDVSENGFILIPKEGTNVLIGTIGDDENSLYLTSIDEIEKVIIRIDQSEWVFDASGFNADLSTGKLTLKNDNASVKTILLDIVSMVKQLTVSTANGPSGTPLTPTVQAATQLENDINNLFD